MDTLLTVDNGISPRELVRLRMQKRIDALNLPCGAGVCHQPCSANTLACAAMAGPATPARLQQTRAAARLQRDKEENRGDTKP